MSNVDNEGLRTLDEIQARRARINDPAADQIVREVVSAYEGGTHPVGAASSAATGSTSAAEAEPELASDIDKLADMIASSPKTWEHIAERFPGLAHQIERVIDPDLRVSAVPEPAGDGPDWDRLNDEFSAFYDDNVDALPVRARDQLRRIRRKVTALCADRDRQHERVDAAIAAGAEVLVQAEDERDAARAELAQVRLRFGIAAGEDLYEGLSRKVGELQTSEAELVSAPLHRQIEELDRSVQARDRLLEAATREREEAGFRTGRSTPPRTPAEALRWYADSPECGMSPEGRAWAEKLRIWASDLDLAYQRALDERDAARKRAEAQLKARETEIHLLEAALADWRKAGEKIASAVYDRATTDALEADCSDTQASARLAEVVQEVRAAMPRLKPQG